MSRGSLSFLLGSLFPILFGVVFGILFLSFGYVYEALNIEGDSIFLSPFVFVILGEAQIWGLFIGTEIGHTVPLYWQGWCIVIIHIAPFWLLWYLILTFMGYKKKESEPTHSANSSRCAASVADE